MVVVITKAINYAKLQSNRHHQQTRTQLFAGQMCFLSSNQQCESTEGCPCNASEVIQLLLLLTGH